MAPSRIGTLELRIRATDARPALASQCQTLTRRVLEQVVDRLDHGDRVVLIRQLGMRWRLPEQALAAEDALERLASDLIAALEPVWSTPIEPPDPEADVAVFTDAAAWWSDALLARTEGRLAWYHQRILDPEPLTVLAEPEHKMLALSVLRRLGQSAPAVLRSAPPLAVLALAETLDNMPPVGAIEAQPESSEAVAWEDAAGLDPSALPPEAQAGMLPAIRSAFMALASLALHLARAPASEPIETRARAFVRAGAPARLPTGGTTPSAADRSDAAEPQPRLEREAEPALVLEPAPEARSSAQPAQEHPAAPGPLLETTAYAGLVYLVPLLMELGTPEHLWQVCLPEGRFLRWAATGLIGEDPILAWLGSPEGSLPAVTAAQADEILSRGCEELARALLRRRPDSRIPDLELLLTGSELIARLPDSVFPIWSSVCSGASEVREAAAVLAAHWPGSLSIPPSLEGLGLRGRQSVQRDRPPRRVFRHDGPEPAARLATAVIGTAAALFEWRLDEPPHASVSAFIERWLRLTGRLEAAEDRIILHLRARDVAFAVRRAGLDRDPGWLPWLERTLVLRFDGEEPEGDALPLVADEDR